MGGLKFYDTGGSMLEDIIMMNAMRGHCVPCNAGTGLAVERWLHVMMVSCLVEWNGAALPLPSIETRERMLS